MYPILLLIQEQEDNFIDMELKGTHTQANLLVAFSGESQAAEKYAIYAEKARADGFGQIADILEETAANEYEHARLWFKLLNGGEADTAANLLDAAHGEEYEWSQMYPAFAAAAKEEGFEHIAALMERIASIEKRHEERFQALRQNVESGQVFTRTEPQRWICSKCGYVHEGASAPEVCPVCAHRQGHYELLCENY